MAAAPPAYGPFTRWPEQTRRREHFAGMTRRRGVGSGPTCLWPHLPTQHRRGEGNGNNAGKRGQRGATGQDDDACRNPSARRRTRAPGAQGGKCAGRRQECTPACLFCAAVIGMHPCLPFLRCSDLTTALLLQRLTYYCARFLLSIFLGLFCTSVHTTYLLTNLHTHTYTHTHNLQRGHQAVSPSAAVTSPRHQDAMGISTTISISCRGLQDHLPPAMARYAPRYLAAKHTSISRRSLRLLHWHPCLPFLRCCDLTTALLLQRLTYYCTRSLLSIFLCLFCTSVHTTYFLTNLHTHIHTHTQLAATQRPETTPWPMCGSNSLGRPT